MGTSIFSTKWEPPHGALPSQAPGFPTHYSVDIEHIVGRYCTVLIRWEEIKDLLWRDEEENCHGKERKWP